MAKKLEYGQCVRLYDKNGKHKLSILRCFDDEKCIDIALPCGKVLDCGVMNYVLETIIENMDIEELPRPA